MSWTIWTVYFSSWSEFKTLSVHWKCFCLHYIFMIPILLYAVRCNIIYYIFTFYYILYYYYYHRHMFLHIVTPKWLSHLLVIYMKFSAILRSYLYCWDKISIFNCLSSLYDFTNIALITCFLSINTIFLFPPYYLTITTLYNKKYIHQVWWP